MDQSEPSQQRLLTLLGEGPALYLCIYVTKYVDFLKPGDKNRNHLLLALKQKLVLIMSYRLGACGQALSVVPIATRMLSPKIYLSFFSRRINGN